MTRAAARPVGAGPLRPRHREIVRWQMYTVCEIGYIAFKAYQSESDSVDALSPTQVCPFGQAFVPTYSYSSFVRTFNVKRFCEVFANELSACAPEISGGLRATTKLGLAVTMHYTPAKFTQLLKALSTDIVDAHIHWRLATDIAKSLQDHPLVAAQSNTFWSLTHKSHVVTALQCLARAFDQEQSALHLLSWLRIIHDNQSIFDVKEFKPRLRDNPFVESLAAFAQSPNPETLEIDVALCAATNPQVNLLVRYRCSQAAHRSKRSLQPGTHDLTDAVVEALLDGAKTIFNRYSYMFAAATYSTSIIGRDDYRFIFSAVEAAVHRGRSHGEA